MRGRLCVAVVAVLAVLAVSPAAAPAYDPFFAGPSTAADFGAGTRPYGVAAGDFDGDGVPDIVAGRTTGNVAFVRGNGDGTFAAPVQLPFKQAFFNAWSMAAGDVDGDGRLDLVWAATADSTGCAVAGCSAPSVQVADGDVRAWLGNGDGTFQEAPYFVSGVRHNKGVLLADVGTDAAGLAIADVDADGDRDVVAGSIDGTNAAVKVLRNSGGGAMTVETVVSQAAGTTVGSPLYFPITTAAATTSPWGVAFGDADGDGDQDLFVGDRALYVYLFANDGTGAFALRPGNIPGLNRPNVYLRHDGLRPDVGRTPALATGDVTGDGRADLAVGLHSGSQTPASGVPNDGAVVLHVSRPQGHATFGTLADVGTNPRGLQALDANGDGHLDWVAGEYDGKVRLLRQLPPRDGDGDGVSDYVDNAPEHPNAPRLDMDTDGAITYRDQLDNDADTVLGDPEDRTTWRRMGDAADPDDDGDGVPDGDDACRLVADPGQADADGDGRGDACDPLDETDGDRDGLPDGPVAGDALFEESRDAAIKWSRGDTHFVIRIDALGRFFQNEFTGLMTDAATASPASWPGRCQGMYTPGTDPDPGCATLPGGKEVPVSLVVIPRLLWMDPEVIHWINDRNDDERFELGQHGTYHAGNTGLGDWAGLPDRNFFSCELCGFGVDEGFALLRAGKDTLLGHYGNPWLARGGADASDPRIDWSTSANPLISYAPPFNASDDASREALAWLGYRAFSASVHEEGGGSLGQFFSPDEQAHEAFDRYGVFHASADTELEPPETTGGAYDAAAYEAYLQSETDHGGLTTWLIEEVEWSGRPCNELDRLDDLCNGASNREDNTVYRPRWDGWMQLLDYVRSYPGGVVMTLGEVALARGYDNAPTVANPGQADADHDGIGDVIEGAALDGADAGLSRNRPGTLTATLTNGAGAPLADQRVTFAFDADGDGDDEHRDATTDAAGQASVTFTPTRPTGPATFTAAWDGGRGVTAQDQGAVDVADSTALTLEPGPSTGDVTDTVAVAATLADSDGAPLAGRPVVFSIGGDTATGTTDGAGRATATIALTPPAGERLLEARFALGGGYGPSSDSRTFTVEREATTLTLSAPVTVKGRTTADVQLLEDGTAGVAGRAVELFAESKGRNPSFVPIGSVQTGGDGRATAAIPANHKHARLRAVFAGDDSYGPSAVTR